MLALELTVVAFTMILLTAGVSLAARVLLVTEDDALPFGDYVGLCLVLTLTEGVFTAIAGTAFLPLAHVSIALADLILLSGYAMTATGAFFLLNGLYSYGHLISAGRLEAIGSLVALLATAVLAFLAVKEVSLFFGALALGPILQILASLSMFKRLGYDRRPRCSPGNWRRLNRTGLSGVGLGLAQSASYRLDRYIVGLFLTPRAVGLYSVAATASELVRLLPNAIGPVLLHRTADRRTTAELGPHVYNLSMAAIAAVVTTMFLAAPWAITTVFGPSYAESAGPLRILLLGELATASFLLDSSRLVGWGRIPLAALCATLGLVVVTGLDVAVIRPFGIEGAAWASVVGYWVMAGLARYFVIRNGSAKKPPAPVFSPAQPGAGSPLGPPP